MKKLCRHFASRPWVLQSVGQDHGLIEVFVDAGWGGCTKSRLSASGGASIEFGICLNGEMARISGEAQLHADAQGMREGLRLNSMCLDMGTLEVKDWTAALAGAFATVRVWAV